MDTEHDATDRTGAGVPHRLLNGAARVFLTGRLADTLPASLYWALAAQYRERYAVRVGDGSQVLRPYKSIELSPDSVEQLTGRAYPPWENRFESLGSVRGGDWDRRPLSADPERHPSVRLYGGREMRETVLYRSLRDRFEREMRWEETELFAVLREELDAGRAVWHDCDTEEGVRRRCERLDDLYETLRRDGYRSQLELARRDGAAPDDDAFPRVMRHEIAVDVSRDGEPLLVEGKHRLMLADLLDIETVTAVVYVRHPKWMAKRDAVANGGPDRRSHPDLCTMRS